MLKCWEEIVILVQQMVLERDKGLWLITLQNIKKGMSILGHRIDRNLKRLFSIP